MVTAFDPLDARSLPTADLRRIYDLARRSGARGRTPGFSDADRAELAALQGAGRRAAWNRRLPVLFADARLHQVDDVQDPQRRIRRWLDHPTSLTLVLTGPPGRGKTHAGYAVGAEALQRGLWAVAWTVADFNAACRPLGDCREFDEAISCDVLILDDLGREQVTDWTVELLQRILDGRLRQRRRTVVPTNLTGAQVRDRYGQPILSRLSDRVTAVRVNGPDRRQPDPW